MNRIFLSTLHRLKWKLKTIYLLCSLLYIPLTVIFNWASLSNFNKKVLGKCFHKQKM